MNFVVIGAGAWGTAFALHLARMGLPVTLAPRRAEQARSLAEKRENVDYLPNLPLPPTIRIAHEGEVAWRDAEVLLFASPAQALRETSHRLRASIETASRLRAIVSLAKGLEVGTHRRPSEILSAELPGALVSSLTGPTNALGVARGDPSAMVLAAARPDAALQEIQSTLSGPTLRVYTSDDLPGVEYGGCLKNIYAIAAGCCDGLRLGDNTKAALLTRALAEMVRVGTALGAKPSTFYGLSGFGDLVATCYGGWSRNREFGQRIGEGRSVTELIAHRKTVVEGYKTTEAFADLCASRGIDAPILREMQAILSEGKRPAAALAALMTRELKSEAARVA